MGASTQGAPLAQTAYFLPNAGVEKPDGQRFCAVGRGGCQTFVLVEQEIHKSEAIHQRAHRVNII